MRGQYPVVGRFSIAGSDPSAADPMAQVRGFITRIITPNGPEWRGAAIDAPGTTEYLKLRHPLSQRNPLTSGCY